jgi:hypothetical protein
MESEARRPRRKPPARRRAAVRTPPPPKIVSVRAKLPDGTPAFDAFALAAAARFLGLPADLAAGAEVAPGVVLLLRDDGVEFRVAAADLKQGYRVANDWAIAIREVATAAIRIQTLARDDVPAPS